MLYPLFLAVWNEERFPSDWKKGIIVKIPKKGDLSNSLQLSAKFLTELS
jgi:hypothetical protein